jgi:RNA polymerase sigma factor for flagellar operon FliA
MSVDQGVIRERVESALDLVGTIARQVSRALGSSVELEELESYGREGLLDAARRFDPSREVPFRGYASFRVRGAIIDGVRSNSRLPRRVHEKLNGLSAAQQASEGAFEDTCGPNRAPVDPAAAEQALGQHLASMATAMALGLVAPVARGEEGEQMALDASEDPEVTVARRELAGIVRDAIEELSEQEATLVRRHYLEGDRFDHVAAELGLSKSWASRLHTRALQKLTKRLRNVQS